MKYPDEILYCAKFLRDREYIHDGKLDPELEQQLDDFAGEYTLVKVEKGFFVQLAEGLRKLWPTGEKDGKYPWRDSVSNLSRRLELMWVEFKLTNYTLEECLTAARKYLNQFQDNAKYMKTLKYFILKQDKVIDKNGRIRYSHTSTFAQMLESVKQESAEDWFQNEEEVTTSFWEGELI